VIIKVLHQHGFVKESVEGVDRMFNEMENAELPDPEYTDNAFMLNVTIRNGVIGGDNWRIKPCSALSEQERIAIISLKKLRKILVRKYPLNISTRTVDRTIKALILKGLIVREGSKKIDHAVGKT
jgi:predicted HTH transcriptional regulator